ncbi:hypothetical protein MRX96_030146 [Rhipicephalus microplus]
MRTDSSLRDADHHLLDTGLKELPIDLIKQVPLDYMHLACLGVVPSKLSELCFWPVSEIALKWVRLPFRKKNAVFPMRHLQ